MTNFGNPIGVFDSGIGGLSILKALRAQMPQESFVYYADSAHNPYGPKGDVFVIDRSHAITQQLINDHHIKALVVACNTATGAAITALRDQHPSLPIIGVEPALKPAVALSRTQRIAVLATRGTLQSAKFLALKATLQGQNNSQAELVCTACDGLADAIEQHDGSASQTAIITNLIASYLISTSEKCQFGPLNGQIDTLVLGCTHYPLMLPVFRSILGEAVHIVDNGQAVARRLAQCITPAPPHAGTANTTGTLTLLSSGQASHLADAAARWLAVDSQRA